MTELERIRDDIRQNLKGLTYLDYAGASLYSSFQVHDTAAALTASTYGNPVSGGPSAARSANLIEASRDRVLKLFGVSKSTHHVLFTSGASGSLQLIGYNLPWTSESAFIVSSDCHQSLLSIKDIAAARKAKTQVLDPMQMQKLISSSSDNGAPEESTEKSESDFLLFAIPGECNFTGQKFNLNLTKDLKKSGLSGYDGGRVLTLVDGAKLAATSPVDLSEHSDIDAFVVSFYKIIGHPMGLGAVIVRRGSPMESLLKIGKSYFGGGTADVYSATTDYRIVRKSLDMAMEDGSANTHALLALNVGLDQLEKIGGVQAIANVAQAAALETKRELLSLRYKNGNKLVKILQDELGPENEKLLLSQDSGSVVSFVVYDKDGGPIGHKTVERFAALEGITLRSGSMCNPGACQRLLGITPELLEKNFRAGYVCGGDKNDVIDGVRTGAVRASFGLATTRDDVDILMDFLRDHFLNVEETIVEESVANAFTVERIVLYPVKGLAGRDVSKWLLGPKGLLHDRKFSIVEPGIVRAVSLKKNPRMALVTASMSLEGDELRLSVSEETAKEAGGDSFKREIVVPLIHHEAGEERTIRVCGRMEKVQDFGDPASWKWLSDVLQATVRIVSAPSQMQNEDPLLVVNRQSVRALNRTLKEEGKPSAEEDVFRGNVYIETEPQSSASLEGGFRCPEFEVAKVKACVRCKAINVDKTGGSRPDYEPLRTLARQRSESDKIVFGELFDVMTSELTSIYVGQKLERVS